MERHTQSTFAHKLLHDLQESRTSSQQRPLFTWLDDGARPTASLTFRLLDESSARLALHLQRRFHIQHGDHILLVFPPGLEFVIAFFACFRLGAISVPVYPPSGSNLGAELHLLNQLVSSSGAKLALTSSFYKKAKRMLQIRHHAHKWPEAFKWFPSIGLKNTQINTVWINRQWHSWMQN